MNVKRYKNKVDFAATSKKILLFPNDSRLPQSFIRFMVYPRYSGVKYEIPKRIHHIKGFSGLNHVNDSE